MDNQIVKIGTQEDDTCNREGCEGTMQFTRGGNGDCSCHISPPCWNCANSMLECADCGAIPEDAVSS